MDGGESGDGSAMGRPHSAEGTLQHHQAGARVEPAGEEEERVPQADLEEEFALRAAMGGGQDLRQGQSEMEESS
nr:hypothetical protein BaRGS_007144 [Batillaria attramentaria]KAG5704772.1 hypothetical protein BaRGS_015155 [Batillaria attramentaria]